MKVGDDGWSRKMLSSSMLASSDAMWRLVRPLFRSCRTKRNRKKETKMRKSLKNKRRWSALNIYLGANRGAHQQQDLDTLRVQLPSLQQLQLLVGQWRSQLLQLLHDGVVGQDGGVQWSQTSGWKTATFYHCSNLPKQQKKGKNFRFKKIKYRHS